MEFTQDFTIFAEGVSQTVQQWLTISNEESAIVHPESNYQNVVGIWNSSIETEESMTDEQIMTLLQGPLRLPRRRRSAAFDIDTETHSTGAATLSRCSSSLLLFCYYFLFQQDPYGHEISRAWIHSRSLKDGISVPLYEYLSQYWHCEKWLGMLRQCNDLDFRGLAQRQQEKFSGFTYAKAWDCERGSWVRKKTALFKFSEDGDGQPGVWIGPLGDCQAVFEFDDQEFEDGFLAESEALATLIPKASPSIPVVTSPMPKPRQNLFFLQRLNLAKALSQQLFIGGVIVFVTFFYSLYLYV